MDLQTLLRGAALEPDGLQDLQVTVSMVTSNSRKVTEGAVFLCLVGRSSDGHAYAAQALEKGAICVVAQRDLGLGAHQLVVGDTRLAYGLLCSAFYGHPSKKLKLVGVTGTNGKTTVTTLAKQVLEQAGHKVGLIGTIQNQIDTLSLPAKFTTPEPEDLHALFASMVTAGCDCAVMEVSSQALDQGRLCGVTFDAAIFTNLTQDHLDYHGDMEHYFSAKRQLFLQARSAAVNADDAYGRRLLAEAVCPMSAYGTAAGCDFAAADIQQRVDGVSFTLVHGEQRIPVQFGMPGLFSVYNILAVIAACRALGLELDAICRAVAGCHGVFGRAEVLYRGAFTVICDFAHTADALENLLSTLRPFVPGRLVVLFGCAGQRDRTKRPKMAGTVAQYADVMVISSDNPRNEDPYVILEDTVSTIRDRGVPYHLEVDRYYAIRWAIEQARPNDVVVLCGKGHENYQVIDTCTVYFDEHEIVAEAVKEWERAHQN